MTTMCTRMCIHSLLGEEWTPRKAQAQRTHTGRPSAVGYSRVLNHARTHVRLCHAKDGCCWYSLLYSTPSVQWRRHVSKLNHPIPAAHTLGHSGKPLHLNVKCGHGSYELMSTAELTHHDPFFSLQNATDFSANKNCKSQAPVGVSTVKCSRN